MMQCWQTLGDVEDSDVFYSIASKFSSLFFEIFLQGIIWVDHL